jgi:hypothetical protein
VSLTSSPKSSRSSKKSSGQGVRIPHGTETYTLTWQPSKLLVTATQNSNPPTPAMLKSCWQRERGVYLSGRANGQTSISRCGRVQRLGNHGGRVRGARDDRDGISNVLSWQAWRLDPIWISILGVSIWRFRTTTMNSLNLRHITIVNNGSTTFFTQGICPLKDKRCRRV